MITSDAVDGGAGHKDFATIQHYLETRQNRLANLMDEVPSLSPAVLGMCEGVLRILEDRGIDPRALRVQAKITQDGRIFLDLNLP